MAFPLGVAPRRAGPRPAALNLLSCGSFGESLEAALREGCKPETARQLLPTLVMKTVFRAFPLWAILFGLSWLLVTAVGEDLIQPLAASALFLLPAVAGGLTVWVALAWPTRWPARIGFLTPTVLGWFVLLLLAQGRTESRPAERLNLLLAFGFAGLLTVWLAVKLRSFPTWRVFRELALVAAAFALAGGVFFWRYNAGTQAIARRAEARWAEIGLPMAEFEKTLAPSQENAGSEVIRQVLREQVSSHFYKDGTRAADREPAIERSKATTDRLLHAAEIASAELPPSDDVDLSAQPVAAIEPLAPALEEDYRRILAVEPAAWASDPHDGYFINVPNFLGVRQFAQLAAADAMRRFSTGDQEGAARALAAGLRLGTGLRRNPTLVSLMIDIAVDALLSSKQVRLPASENGLQAIAADAVDLRAEFLKRLQLEGWICLRMANQLVERQTDETAGGGFLPKWAERIESQTWVRRQIIAVLNGAEHAAIQKDPATAALPDLGISLHNAVSAALPTFMEFNSPRAAMRMTATLLLREQTELIRDARARLAAGRPVESYQSAIIPGARWELTADADKGTVATHLVGAPEWIVKQVVTPGNFWVLPLDGSVAWKFHRPAKTASGF
jgi:hypothetical protein